MPFVRINKPCSTDKKMRHCLGIDCGRVFESTHAGHRFCQKCLNKLKALDLPKMHRIQYEVIMGHKTCSE